MQNSTELVVIGGGPGGYAAAFYAADKGMEVSLVDLDVNPGGVCLYRGCIPSKALLHAAKVINESKEAAEMGITFGEPKIDLDKLREFKNNVVDQMTGGVGQLSKRRKINYIQGRATFVSSNKISIEKIGGGTEELEFKTAILATGSVPATIPGIEPTTDKIMDSTGALELKDIPKKLLVIGGGYIGLELGSVYSAIGSKVTVVEMTPALLPGADKDMVNVLAKNIEKNMDKIYLNTKVTGIKEIPEGVEVTFDGESLENEKEIFDRVLISIGRKPVTKGLGLENTKVSVNERGFVNVNAQLKTDDTNIYAIGDIAGDPMLAHKATAEGKVAVEAILGHKVAFEPNAIPAVVFTDPELAWAGITETEAKAQGLKVDIARYPWAANGRTVTLGKSDGMTKLIIDPETDRILGMGVVGSGAGELIAEGVLAVEMGALARDVALSIHPHPTLSETVMETAEVYYGESVHVYKPKRKKKK